MVPGENCQKRRELQSCVLLLFRAHRNKGTLYIYKFIIVKRQERRIRWGVPKQPEKGEDKWAETEREHKRGSQNNCLCCDI